MPDNRIFAYPAQIGESRQRVVDENHLIFVELDRVWYAEQQRIRLGESGDAPREASRKRGLEGAGDGRGNLVDRAGAQCQ